MQASAVISLEGLLEAGFPDSPDHRALECGAEPARTGLLLLWVCTDEKAAQGRGGGGQASPPEAKYLVMQDFGGGWREWGRGEGTPHTFLQRLEQGGAR